MERSRAYVSRNGQKFFLHSLSSAMILILPSHIPQRLHRTCVLLWRLPKLDVPFAVPVVSLRHIRFFCSLLECSYSFWWWLSMTRIVVREVVVS